MARLIYGGDLYEYIISGGDVLEGAGTFVKVSISQLSEGIASQHSESCDLGH